MVSFKLPTGVLQKAFIHSFYEKMTTLRSNHNNEYCYLVFQHRLRLEIEGKTNWKIWQIKDFPCPETAM